MVVTSRCICGRDAVAEHHVVAECHSPNTVVPVCGECHKKLDASLYYAGVHRRDRSSQRPVDRDYALLRGVSDTFIAMLTAAGSDPGLIKIMGRAQYALGQHVAMSAPPEQRIGPRPPTSGAFQIKVGRLDPSRVGSRSPSTRSPDWLDRLQMTFLIWSGLIGDYTVDVEHAEFFARLAAGLGEDRLRAWVGDYRADDLTVLGDRLQQHLDRYVAAVLDAGRSGASPAASSEEVNESAQDLATDLKAFLVMLVDVCASRSKRGACEAVDAYLARYQESE